MNISTLPHQILIHSKQPLQSLPPESMEATGHVSAFNVVPFSISCTSVRFPRIQFSIMYMLTSDFISSVDDILFCHSVVRCSSSVYLVLIFRMTPSVLRELSHLQIDAAWYPSCQIFTLHACREITKIQWLFIGLPSAV